MTSTLPRALRLCVAIATIAGAATAVSASEHRVRVGIAAGYQATSGDFDVLGERVLAAQPTGAGLIGLRIGWEPVSVFGFELGTSLAPAGTRGRDLAVLLPLHLDAVFRPLGHDTTWQPTLALGGGFYAAVGGDAGSDLDGLFYAAAGLEVAFDPTLSLRAEVALFITDGVEAAISVNPAFLIGIDIIALGGRRDDDGGDLRLTPIAGDISDDDDAAISGLTSDHSGDGDRDLDGIENSADRCPAHRGLERDAGCPDTDHDGVIDAFDRCPIHPGRGGRGCPDSDDDGVTDAEDACPRQQGPVLRYGCP